MELPRRSICAAVAAAAFVVTGCVPRVTLPPLPVDAPGILARGDSLALLASQLAPTLFVQRDEPFPLLRVVAVVNPTRPVIAYHLLWAHDVNGQWLPWAKPSDEEEVWVGYDRATRAATDIWTYWHGTILHAVWPAGVAPAVDVQWGKHGSLPHRTIESDLPRLKTLNVLYAIEFVLLPDIWIGKLAHGGPWGFFHGYARYRDFSRVIPLTDRLDAVIAGDDPRAALHALFGERFSNKAHWPWSK